MTSSIEDFRWSIGDILHPRNTEPIRVLDRAKGSFGAVYICEEQRGGRRAVKTILEKHLRDHNLHRRFLQEVNVWIRLGHHPNIVAVEMVDTIDGRLCMLLECVDGGSLATHLEGGPLPISRAHDLALEIAMGMSYVWQSQRIVHRDLKPANLLLTRSGQLKVSDFGLAHALGFAGTPLYMAPEQHSSHVLDCRTDVFAFGLILLEMLVGTRFLLSIRRNQGSLTDFREVAPEVPENIRLLVQDCLRAVAGRPRDFAEIIRRLGPRRTVSRTSSDVFSPTALEPRMGQSLQLADKAVKLANLGQLEEAIVLYDQALALNDQWPEVWKSRATALLGLHRYEEALISSDLALALLPKCAAEFGEEIARGIRQMTWTNKTSALAEMQRYEEGLAACEEALRDDPDYPRLWNNKGSILMRLGRLDEAQTCIQRAIEIDTKYEKAWQNKGELLLQRGEIELAKGAFEHLLEINPRNIAGVVGLLDCARMLGRTEDIEERLHEIERLDPNAYRALVQFFKQRLPESPTDLRAAADVCLQAGDNGKAAQLYEQALVLEPGDVDLWNNRGLALHRSGRRREAVACYRQALECQSNHAWALTNLSNFFLEEGNVAQATIYAKRAIESDPNNDMAWMNYGAALARLERWEAALDKFSTAVTKNPNNATAWTNLGACRLKLGDFASAKASFREALALDPNNRAARQMLAQC